MPRKSMLERWRAHSRGGLVAKQRVSPSPPHPKAGLVRVPSLPRTAHALKQSRRTRPLALPKSAPLPLQQGLYIVFFVGATSLQLPHVTRWPLRVHLMGYPAAGGVHVVHCVHLVSGPPIVEAIGFQHLSGRALPPIERRWVRRSSLAST